MLEITPEEIRDIRHSLGLTQVEAGELLGGGPRAFTKYEAGAVKPAASVVHLLRLLEENPAAMAILGGRIPQSISAVGVGPFDVTGDHISILRERDLPVLLRKLLIAEAQDNHLPVDGIQVASNIHTPDGGEDGRIWWTEGPERTPNLPSRFCQFQLKGGGITRAAAGKDVLTAGGHVKDMVHKVLSSGGHYILLCAQSYTQRQIEQRENSIRKALREAGMDIADEQVDFRDADQMASWVNCHPSVATWAKERTQPGATGPFRSWNHWAGRGEHDSSQWVEDDRLPELRAWLHEKLAAQHPSLRVVGLSGVGKSRLILQALGPTGDGTAEDTALSDIVLYAVESEVRPEIVIEGVQNLTDMGLRAIVVVDECAPDTHRILDNIVSRAGSRLSLVTIDHEIPSGSSDDTTFKLEEAPLLVTQTIIDRVPNLDPEDQRRLARFSRGFPGIGIRVAHAWRTQLPVAHATDDNLVDAFVLGRNSRRPESLLRSAALIAAFGLVQAEPQPDGTVYDSSTSAVPLSEIVKLVSGLTADELYADIQELRDRGIVQRRGRFTILQPRPIAMKLAERQWRDWTHEKWDEVLGGNISPDFKRLAARQLALLNTTERAATVVAHVCRPAGPFGGMNGVAQLGHPEVLSALAEVDATIVAELLERFLDDVGDPYIIQGALRRSLVFALEKIAFPTDTFEDGARLLLRLAVAENERWGNNATEQFKALFPLLLGNTAANGDLRLSVLDYVAETEDPRQRAIVVEALTQGTLTHHFSRIGSAGAHGSRPNLESWRPATDQEAHKYVEGCVSRLARFSKNDDEPGPSARAGLGQHLRSLACYGFIDIVEEVIGEVSSSVTHWPEALESLGDVIRYDADRIGPEVTRRVRSLIARLQPQGMESRLRLIVTEMSWDYPDDEKLDYETRSKRQVEAVRELAGELLRTPEILTKHLSQLSRQQRRTTMGRVPQRRTFDFGSAIADLSESPNDWQHLIVQAVVDTPEHERDFGLLSGYVTRIAMDCPELEKDLKELVAGDPQLAPAFPLICLRIGIRASDVAAATDALQSGLLHSYNLRCWSFGEGLSKVPSEVVAPLFDVMLAQSAESYSVALDLMVMYAYRGQDKLEGLRPQIRRVVESATRSNLTRAGRDTPDNFSDILTWLLSKGREDADARAVALDLAKVMVDIQEFDEQLFVEPLVPVLLSGFPEIVWPLVSQAIISDPIKAFGLKLLLRGSSSFEPTPCPAILSLPEDALFAWCHAHPNHAPAFAAELLPILTSFKVEELDRSLHPVISRLIDEFGDRDDVWVAIGGNMHTFGWSGSATTYFDLYREPLNSLRNHPKANVRTWVRKMLRDLDSSINSAHDHDEEWLARGEL